MSWLDSERKRHNTQGGSYKGAMERQTVNQLSSKFMHSNTYREVEIEGVKYHTRLLTEKKHTVASGYTVMKLMFLPYTKILNGTYLELDGKTWLTVYVNEKELAPHSYIRECKDVIKINYKDEDYLIPCLTETRIRDTQKINELNYIDLSLDSLKITMPYNKITNSIKAKDKFLIGDRAWEIQGKDNITQVSNGRGVIEFSSKVVPLTEEMKKELEGNNSMDITLEILGENDIPVNTKEQYEAKLYHGKIEIQPVSVQWYNKDGLIDENGLFKSLCDIGKQYIKVTVEYLDNCNEKKTITGDKEVNIYNKGEWW